MRFFVPATAKWLVLVGPLPSCGTQRQTDVRFAKALQQIQGTLDVVAPVIFAREKKYLTLVIERT